MSYFPFLPLSCAGSGGARGGQGGSQGRYIGCGGGGGVGDLGLGAAIVLQLQFDHLPSPGSLSLLGLLPGQQIGFSFHSRNAGHGVPLTGWNPTLGSCTQ